MEGVIKMEGAQYKHRKENRANKQEENAKESQKKMYSKIDGINRLKKEIKEKYEDIKDIDFDEKIEELKKEGHTEESEEIKKYKKIQENLPKIKNILELQKILDKEAKKIEEEIINRGIPEKTELQKKNNELEKLEKELKELENNPEKNEEKIKEHKQYIQEKEEEISNIEKNIEEQQEKRKEKKSDYGELSDNALLNRYSKVKSQSARCDLILQTLLAGKEWKDIDFNKNLYVSYKDSSNAKNKLFEILKQERQSRETENKKQEQEGKSKKAGNKKQEQEKTNKEAGSKTQEKNKEGKETKGAQINTAVPANQILQQETTHDEPQNTEMQENQEENTNQDEKRLAVGKTGFFSRLLNNIKSRFKLKRNIPTPEQSKGNEQNEAQIIDAIINSKFSKTAEFVANNGMEKFKEKYKIQVEETGNPIEKPTTQQERTNAGKERD